MRYLILALMCLSLSCKSQNQDMGRLIYVGDPMCSWCYGITNELAETIATIKDEVEVEIVMGGLRPFNTQTMLDLKDFLTHHWQDVHERSGQEFSYEILNTDILYDTEPACRAVVVARSMNSDMAMAYFKEVQKRFYKENNNPQDIKTYTGIAEELKLDPILFEEKFKSEEFKALVKKDFEKAFQLGVNSFPTIILQQGEESFMIAKGYQTSAKMIAKIGDILNKAKD